MQRVGQRQSYTSLVADPNPNPNGWLKMKFEIDKFLKDFIESA